MKPRFSRIVRQGSVLRRIARPFVALILSCLVATAQETTPPSNTPAPPSATLPEEEAPKLPNDQLDSLVAPIALYPDTLLAQTLVASTYPLEVIQLHQWMEKNKNLKDKALSDAVGKQKWDPSIQALAAFPQVTQRLAGNISWTTDLGNAFLAQQADVMDAVQRMRSKAESKGNLKTTSQQKVVTQKVEGDKEVIVIQQADPQVVYVPSYDPEVVYGPSAYPYYPYSYPGYYPGMGLAWGTGLILGAAWINNNWGDCNWGNGDININNNNNFNRNDFNRNNISNRPGGGDRNNRWQHRPEHRGNAPYSNRATQKKYGDARRSQAANRPSQQPNRGPGGDRRTTDRPSTADRKAPDRSASNRQTRPSDRSASNRQTSNRKPSSANRPQTRSSNSIGNRQVSRSPSPRSNNAFSAPSRQMSRSSSFASQSRGFSSMGGSRGGMRSGGMRGGGRRR